MGDIRLGRILRLKWPTNLLTTRLIGSEKYFCDRLFTLNSVSEYKDERAISKDEILNGKEFTFIDTRSAQELATQPGIPGAIPFEWIRGMEKDGKFKSKIELEQIFKSIGITQDQSIVTYCKLGIRAAHVAFILENLLGFNKVRVYEGSMLEYLNV